MDSVIQSVELIDRLRIKYKEYLCPNFTSICLYQTKEVVGLQTREVEIIECGLEKETVRDTTLDFIVDDEDLKRPAKVGQKCIECHVKEINRNNNKRKNVPRNLRVELGLCYFCGEVAIPGKRTCEKHYKIVSENLKKWNRDNTNHYWRKYDRAGVEFNHWYKEKKQLE